MVCSAYRRIDDVLYAANKTTGSCGSTHPGKNLFQFLAATWVTAACLCSAAAVADTSYPFIQSLGPAGQSRNPDITRQEAWIDELESRDLPDVYTPELGEAYLGMADQLASRGDYAGALETYGKALQIVRVNDGIDSPVQLPILQAQLDCLEKLRQWNRYDDTLNLIYSISRDNYPAGDAARIDVLDQLGKWQLKAAEEGLLDLVEDRIKAVAYLYEQEISQVEDSGAEVVSDYGLSSLHLGRAYTRLAMAKVVLNKPVKAYRSPTTEPARASTDCRPVQLAISNGSRTCITAPVPNLNDYRLPRDRKKQETGFYLEELRTAILDAAQTLEDRSDFGNRDLLIDEFRFLAESYTKIVSLAQAD